MGYKRLEDARIANIKIVHVEEAEELFDAAPCSTIDETGESLIHASSFLELICWALTNQLLIDLACMIVGCLSLSNFCL